MNAAPPATVALTPRKRRRWLLAALALLPLLALALLLALFRTGAGRDLALAQLRAALGQDTLAWASAEGQLDGGLTLRGLRYRADGLEIDAAELGLDLDSLALLGGRVRLRRVWLNGVRVTLPPADPTPAPWPEHLALPSELPALSLPVALEVESLELHTLSLQQDGAERFALERLAARADWDAGLIRIPSLTLTAATLEASLRGQLDTANDWATDLAAEARLGADADEPLALQARLAGRLSDLALDISSRGEPENRLALRVQGGLAQPQWTLDVAAPRLLPAWFGAQGEALALTLAGSGNLRQAELRGALQQADQRLELLPSNLAYDQRRLTLAPLALALLGGQAQIEGSIDLTPEQPELALGARWTDLTLPSATGEQATRISGHADLSGPLDAYRLGLGSDLHRNGEQATLALTGQGSTQALAIESAQIALPGGRLEAQGRLAWAPETDAALELTLADFDPSWFVPALPGSINASISATAALVNDAPRARLDTTRLDGSLRSQPLSGEVSARLEPDGSGSGRVDLRLGRSTLHGEAALGDRIEARVELAPLHLADWLEDAAGDVSGTLIAQGPRDAPRLRLALEGRTLALDGFAAERLTLDADLAAAHPDGQLTLEGQALTLAGQRLDTLRLVGEGDRAAHRIALALEAPDGQLELRAEGAMEARSSRWSGVLDALTVTPRAHPRWQLRAPAAARFAPEAGQFSLDDACLDAAAASLCLRADAAQDGSRGALSLTQFDLAQLAPLINRGDGPGLTLQGLLDAELQFTRAGDGALQGQLDARVPALTLRPELAEAAPLTLADLRLRADLDPARAQLELESRINESGQLSAALELADPMTPAGALSGRLDLNLPDISALAGFSDQVAAAQGRLEGHVSLAGTREAPKLDGTLSLADLAAQLPALGITLRDGQLSARQDADGSLSLDGRLGMGDGVLEASGRVALDAESRAQAQLSLRGTDLTVMDTPEARVRASPDLRIELADNRLKLRGEIAVPHARIDLEQLQSVRSPSSDVVVVDQAAAEGSALVVDADLTVALGEDVRMNGFGLNGSLGGRLRVRDRPGKPTTARGSIDVGGAYKAYGQDLSITRGRVAWASTPIDTPSLDIRAQRKVDTITVGVQVRGTALVPELTLWSEPAMEQAEQLSYLILGRPLRSASQADGAQLTQAAAALGGNLLAKSLGSKLGVDEIEVADNRALGGAALTVGKALSPRLHVSYGVALFGPGQVITFKYLLSRLWNIQIDSGTENRAALNYRLER